MPVRLAGVTFVAAARCRICRGGLGNESRRVLDDGDATLRRLDYAPGDVGDAGAHVVPNDRHAVRTHAPEEVEDRLAV